MGTNVDFIERNQPLLNKYAAFVKDSRQTIGLSHAEFAKIVQASERDIQYIESGRGNMVRALILTNILKEFNISIFDLLQYREANGLTRKFE